MWYQAVGERSDWEPHPELERNETNVKPYHYYAHVNKQSPQKRLLIQLLNNFIN